LAKQTYGVIYVLHKAIASTHEYSKKLPFEDNLITHVHLLIYCDLNNHADFSVLYSSFTS